MADAMDANRIRHPLCILSLLIWALLAQLAAAQIHLEADINLFGIGSNPQGYSASGFAVLDGKLYFAASHEDFGTELWRYDAATGAAERAADIVPGHGSSDPFGFVVLGADSDQSGR